METRKVGEGVFEIALECRRTRRGAKTFFASGKVKVLPGGMTHWREVRRVHPGEKVPVVNVTNSGRHECVWATVSSQGDVSVIPAYDGFGCSVCEGGFERL